MSIERTAAHTGFGYRSDEIERAHYASEWAYAIWRSHDSISKATRTACWDGSCLTMAQKLLRRRNRHGPKWLIRGPNPFVKAKGELRTLWMLRSCVFAPAKREA
jgi:hypothetical protein